jgi:hypothetical protein
VGQPFVSLCMTSGRYSSATFRTEPHIRTWPASSEVDAFWTSSSAMIVRPLCRSLKVQVSLSMLRLAYRLL